MKKEHKLSQFKHSQFHYIFFKQSKLSKILDKVEQAKCIIIFGTNLVIQRKMIARFSTPYVVLNFARIFSAKLSTNKVVIQ